MAWMKSQSACVLRITDVGTRMTNCDVINIRNTTITSDITSEGTITAYWMREIKRSPDTMKAAAILVLFAGFSDNRRQLQNENSENLLTIWDNNSN